MNCTIHKTRFHELGYRKDAPKLWRIVDMSSGSGVGPQYPTRAELLADLARYARSFGCDGAADADPEEKTMLTGHVLVGEVRDPTLNGRQAAAKWVHDHWNGEREISSWSDNRFSLVYGVSVYEVVDNAGAWCIFRHPQPQGE